MPAPDVLWRRAPGARRRGPLVVLLHGHGVDERDIFPLGELFANATIAAVRGSLPSEGGFRWYAHDGARRPTADSLAAGIARLETWLDAQDASGGVWLAGFSGGAAMAGALLATSPQRYAGVAMLHGALPFDAGVPLEPGRLAGCEVFYGYGELDDVIPRALVDRSCTYVRDESGARAEIHGYRIGHGIAPAEERDLARWYASLT